MVRIGDLISSASSDYEVQDLLGFGTFGEVVQCRKLATNETVALKIIKRKMMINEAMAEERILKTMKDRNSDKFNIVRWNGSFIHEGHFCLEFEELDIDLRTLLERRQCQCLTLKEIRPIVKQLATSLDFLQGTGIVHGDLKPVNIMMVDHVQQPLRVKLIDFGSACMNPEKWTGSTVQTLWYRSPEVMMRDPFNQAIDVWSLGCTAAEMFMGTPLFPGSNEYDMLRRISCTVGQPSDHILNDWLHIVAFLTPQYRDLETPAWRTIASLSDLLKTPSKLSGEEAHAEACDRASFVDLLSKMLMVDVSKRATPSQILEHPFITMSHLAGSFSDSLYVKSSTELMSSDSGEDVSQSSSTASPADDSVPSEDHTAGQSTQKQPFPHCNITSGEHCLTRKRKDGDRSDTASSTHSSSAKRRRRLDAAMETEGQTRSQKSPLLKRQRDSADLLTTSDSSSPTKKLRSLTSVRELTDSCNKLLSSMDEALTSPTQVRHLKKRKRDEEEPLPRTSSAKTQRTKLVSTFHSV